MKNNIAIIFGLIVIVLAFVGCADKNIPGKTTNQSTVQPSTQKDFDLFKNVNMSTTIEEIINSCGQPYRDAGSGIHILVYDLKDGTSIWIGSADYKSIMYLDHVSAKGEHQRMLPEEAE